MRVEILRSRLYRESHLPVGLITDMDDAAATAFIANGWAKVAVEPPALSSTEADALIPKKLLTRNAKR